MCDGGDRTKPWHKRTPTKVVRDTSSGSRRRSHCHHERPLLKDLAEGARRGGGSQHPSEWLAAPKSLWSTDSVWTSPNLGRHSSRDHAGHILTPFRSVSCPSTCLLLRRKSLGRDEIRAGLPNYENSPVFQRFTNSWGIRVNRVMPRLGTTEGILAQGLSSLLQESQVLEAKPGLYRLDFFFSFVIGELKCESIITIKEHRFRRMNCKIHSSGVASKLRFLSSLTLPTAFFEYLLQTIKIP